MTAVQSGSTTTVFRTPESLAVHILTNILSNTKKMVGTEWEMFLLNQEGSPLTPQTGQTVFHLFYDYFTQRGYTCQFHKEQMPSGETITGMTVQGLGAILTEAGHQFEFSSEICRTSAEVEAKNTIFYDAFQSIAASIAHRAVFRGHLPDYALRTQGINKSRGNLWRSTYKERFPNDWEKLIDAQQGTACTQVTIDSGGALFHEYYKALLLIEPLLSMHYANSDRSFVNMLTYGRYIPTQVIPIINVWDTHDTPSAVDAIVDALLYVDIPFVPAEDQDIYVAAPWIAGRPATVRDYMESGRLTEKLLNNVAGFIYTRPALKDFRHGLIEVRGMDSQPTPEIVAEIAGRITRLVYDDALRQSLLAKYEQLSKWDILNLQSAASVREQDKVLDVSFGGCTLAAMIDDIVQMSA